jgi:single-strand DNA-binding protein
MDTQIWMTGRVGTDIEYRVAKDVTFANFRLGCTPAYVRDGDWLDQETVWMSVSCRNRLAEGVRASLHKGDPVVVTGKLRTDKWTDSQGVERFATKLEATSVGHDLTFGQSTFTKREPTPRKEDAAASAESAQ